MPVDDAFRQILSMISKVQAGELSPEDALTVIGCIVHAAQWSAILRSVNDPRA
jgi:hypothetical protein